MGALSHAQFAEHVNAGGASRLLHTTNAVGLERGRYAVSDRDHELTVPAPVTGAQVAQHHGVMSADPRLAHPRAMQGGWEESGSVYLDSSELVRGRRPAVALGNANTQKAVFSHGRELSGDKPTSDVYMKRDEARGKMKELGEEKHKVAGTRRMGFTVERRRL